jgi:hypothetical protein
MKYTVKNTDGELTFDSLTHLRQMYQQGMVEPDDQVRAEDSSIWRKASAIPELRDSVPDRSASNRWLLWGMVAAFCLTLSLHSLMHNRKIFAAVMMVPVLVMSQRATTQVFRKRRE